MTVALKKLTLRDENIRHKSELKEMRSNERGL
jgi:hypothetical protein